jgi:8-oxo-dGTP diphosphatase
MSYIEKLAWIHIQDRKILITLSKGKDTWYIPGGKREAGESDLQALIREIGEELTVQLFPETVEFLGQFEGKAHEQPDGVNVRMICYSGDYQGTLKASGEIAEVRWFQHSERHKCTTVDATIFDWLKEKDLID